MQPKGTRGVYPIPARSVSSHSKVYVPHLRAHAAGSHQSLYLEALLIAQLAACHVRGAAVKGGPAREAVDEGVVADGAPSAAAEEFKAAILRAAVHRHDAVRQARVPFGCTNVD